MRRFQEIRKAQGNCVDCGDRAIPGQLRCHHCQDAHNECMIALRAERAAKGLCRECGEPAAPGETRCELHKSKNAEYIARCRARKAGLAMAS